MTKIILHDVNRSSLVSLCLGFLYTQSIIFPYFNTDGKFLWNYSKKIAQSLSVNIPHADLLKNLIKRGQKKYDGVHKHDKILK